MTDFKALLKTPEYEFLKTNPHLGNNIILLGLGGSYAYGTNVESSDVDVRGIALNTKADILGSSTFEQVVNNNIPLFKNEAREYIDKLIRVS